MEKKRIKDKQRFYKKQKMMLGFLNQSTKIIDSTKKIQTTQETSDVEEFQDSVLSTLSYSDDYFDYDTSNEMNDEDYF